MPRSGIPRVVVEYDESTKLENHLRKRDPMNTIQKALVTVFEDLETAKLAVVELQKSGFPFDKIELVTKDFKQEAPEVCTPKKRETTTSALLDGSVEWGTVGAGIGAVAALIVPFPGVALGMILMGGATGAFVGGLAGIEHAIEDDAVNLPTEKEYEKFVSEGYSLVVVLGTHDDSINAKNIISKIPAIHSHTHPVHGHEFHEHPTK